VLVSVVVALSLGARVAAADTYPRQPIDVVHYAFNLELRDDSNEIGGEATVEVRILEANLAEFALDLASANGGTGMTVSEVSADGRPLRFAHDHDRLRIALASPARVGDHARVLIKYRGVPASGLRIGSNKFGERTFFASSWPDKARQWLPTIDHVSNKATVEIAVTAPSHYQVVSNGRLVEVLDLPNDRRRTRWAESAPIAPWLVTIGVARFAVHRTDPAAGVPLETWVFPTDRDRGYPTFELPARQALEFFSELVGPYPYEKLANVEAAGVTGGMEHASAIAYGEASVTGQPIPTLVAHEIAHAWFGDGVTERDWDDVWLSEGFATYLAHLFVEHVEGRDAFVAGLKRDRNRVIEAERRSPATPVVHRDLADMTKVLNVFVYQKAGWVLHMLRGTVGFEAFRRGLREYYARYVNANASTADFERVMEEVSGVDLSTFFRQWLRRPGVPRIAGTWHYDRATATIEVDLVQSTDGEVFQLPLEIGIVSGPGLPPRIEKVAITGEHHHVAFTVDHEPADVVLDPDTWTLADMTLVKK
jgi:aminopeptidase N